MKVLFAGLLFLLSVSTLAQSKTERMLMSKTLLLIQAEYFSRDKAVLQELLSPNVQYSDWDGFSGSKAEAIAHTEIRDGKYTEDATNATAFSIQKDGDIFILSRRLFADATLSNGQGIRMDVALVYKWQKIEGNWVVIFRSAIADR